MLALDPRMPRRRNALLALLYASLPGAVVFIILNILFDSPLLALLNLGVLITSLGLLVALRRGISLHRAALIYLSVLFTALLATLARPDIHPGTTTWIAIIPVFAYLLLDVKSGLAVTVVALSAAIVAYFAGAAYAPYRLNMLLIAHILTPTLGVFVICHFYSHSQSALTSTLLERALRDPLTGLWNREKLEREFEREQRRASRTGEPLSLLLIDLDHFKRINDGYGHHTGDAVLVAFAHLLKTRTRDTDLHCRIGGEEFATLLPNTDVKGAATIAEHLRQALAMEGVVYQGERIGVTLSAGAVELGRDGETWPELFRAADTRLYACKEQGRNCVRWDDSTADAWPVAS